MAKVYYQAKAVSDLEDVWFEVAQDGVSWADAYLDKLLATCALVAENPKMGVERPEIDQGVRSFPVDRYVVFYEEFFPEGIVILRLWHAAQDPKSFKT